MSADEASELEIVRRRAEFRALLVARLDELGVTEKQRVTYITDRITATGSKVRWQTVQAWVLGESFPGGRNLVALARALDMPEHKLLPPLVDVAPPAAFSRFLETPEGRSITELERYALRLFSWPAEPVVGDYRQLLALYRACAERAA